MLEVVKLSVELVVVSLILSKLEKLSLELGDDEVLLVRLNLSGVEILERES